MNQSKTSNFSKWNILTNCLADRGVFVCPHETAHGRSYEFITGIMYAQTHIHVPRNKLIVDYGTCRKAQTGLRVHGKSPAP